KLELLARLDALLRRSRNQKPHDEVFDLNEFKVNVEARTIARHGAPVDLTQKDFDLAVFLFRNLGRLLSRGHILENVWGRSPNLNTRTVDTHVSRLRSKLGLVPENGWRLVAIYQHGYRLERMQREEQVPASTEPASAA
ncbi:MAG: winged helix-turn-helix domain-containing protein, partial [Burkholderiales bacterium]